MLESTASRRDLLRFFACGAAFAAGGQPAGAGETRIAKLIEQSRTHGTISQRIDFISAALRGTRYLGDTLIGSPRRPEVFVVRDDGFDCVTYCETVLAAALARKPDEFDALLRKIRYHNGLVEWRERNHYFFDWCQHNVENKLCRWVTMDGAVEIHKTVDSQKGLAPRRFDMQVIPHMVLRSSIAMLQAGDIIGFVSHQPELDYFHAGFIAFSPKGVLLLRHASESEHRVADERLDAFLARWSVRYVTIVRPLEPAPAA